MIVLGPGRIFWAVYPGDRGDGKNRPMIVATRWIDILRTGNVVAVVCSTDFTEPIMPIEVRLPFAPDGRCVTGLRRDTVAVCDWTATLPAEEIRETSGIVPTYLLREVFSKAGLTYLPER
jgi:mRNA-degrading endonuclease toxin of MazEF toxin-antitoxin module